MFVYVPLFLFFYKFLLKVSYSWWDYWLQSRKQVNKLTSKCYLCIYSWFLFNIRLTFPYTSYALITWEIQLHPACVRNITVPTSSSQWSLEHMCKSSEKQKSWPRQCMCLVSTKIELMDGDMGASVFHSFRVLVANTHNVRSK